MKNTRKTCLFIPENMLERPENLKVFVTGIGGQLGHDVINELARQNHWYVGSDLQGKYSGVTDGKVRY